MAFDDQDPVDPIEQERLRLRRALQTGVVENPDRLAQDRAEAARRGMTVQDLRAARTRNEPVPPPNWSSLPETSPATSSFVSRPDVAAIAHDDLDNMSTAERLLRGVSSRAVNLAAGLGRTALTTPTNPANILGGVVDRLNIPRWTVDIGPDGVQVRRQTETDNARTQSMAALGRGQDATLGYEPGTTWEQVKADPLRNVIPFALEQGVVSTPDMVAAIAALPAYIAARTGELGQARAENDTRQEATVEDLIAVLPASVGSALLERFATRGILGLDDAVRGGLRGVPAAAGRAAAREAATEAGQEALEYTAETLGTETGFDIAQAGERALAGAVAGGPFGGAVRTVTGTAEVVLRRNEADTAAAERGEQAAQTLEELTRLAEASKVRERDPATFREFIDQAAEGTEVENVYVDGAAFAQSLAEAGVSLDEVVQAIPSLADQLPDAVATGGDVRISTGEFAAHIAGTDAAGVLMQHLKVNPFDMSRAQAEEFMQTRGEELQAEVEAAAVQAAATEEARAGRERVQQRIAEELDRTGRFTSDVNRAYAALPAAFYDVMAKRLGTTVEAVADTYRLRFSAEMPTSGVASTMDQDQMVDLVHFSRAPGLTRSDPSLWGATRATSPEERARKGRAPDRTYFYDAAIRSRPERAVGMLSPFEYRAQVPASRLYDFDADPLGLKPEGPMTADAAADFENAVRERGFLGYRFGSVVTGAVALFEPVDMRQAGPIRTAADAAAVDARAREMAQEDRRARLAARTDPNEMVFTREPEEFRDAAIAELFPDRVFGQQPLTPEQAEARAQRLAEEIPGLKGALPYLTTEEKAKLRRDTAAKITKLIEEFPDAGEMAAVAYAGRAKRGWYENSATAILEIFGAVDAPRFAALLAALSPQTSVESNTFNALATWTNWINAGRPTDRREIIKIMGRSVQGTGTEASVLNAWINNAVTALTAEDPNDITLSGPKVNSFMLNLIGVVDEVTNDAWMASYALVEQSVFKKTGAVPGKGPGYIAMNAVARRAAEIVSEKTGESWSAAEVQETVWSWAKTLYEKRDAAGERRTAMEIAANGGITAEDIASTPDFAVLFVDGVYRRILEAGGYGAELEALDARGQPPRRDGARDADPGSVAGTGFDEGDFVRFIDQAAARLEELRARRREGAPAEAAQLSLFSQGPVDGVFGRFSVENIGDLLRHSDWAILTAENPRGEQASAEDNAQAQARLEADLRDLGAQFLPAVGRYGQVENSYVVTGITEDQARELGRKYDQDSVLTRKGLIYQDGRITPATGVTTHSSRPDDFFTEVPGTGALFTVDLDFDAEQTYAQSQPFYSALLRAVEQSPTTKAPAAQWKATLAKVPGVKAEEIEWSGLNEWLDGITDPETGSQVSGAGLVDAKGNITREAVAEFLRAGGVRVEEVVLGGGAEEFDALIDARIDELMEGGESYGRAANLAMDEFNGRAEAQYSNYKLPGADDTYRELLIRLPRAGGQEFRSAEGHFSGFDDVIAHARFTTRTDAEGNRTLFLEEVQSTHHETGRDQGYRRIPSAEEREAAERELEQARQNLIAAEQANLPAAERIINARLDFYEAKLAELEAKGVGELSRQDLRDTVAMGPERVDIQEYRRIERQLDLYNDLLNAVDPTSGELRNRAAVRAAFDTPSWGPNVGLPMPTEAERAASGHVAAGLRYQEAQFALDSLQGQGIQDAPWRKTWSALVMKRMIRYAVDNGIDQIAWINGNQQNGGTTGGDGAWFYERNLVNVTNDLVKKYGVKVEQIDLRDGQRRGRAEAATARQARVQQELETERDPGARASLLSEAQYQSDELAFNNRPATALGVQNGIRINDKLREAAAGGFPLFQRDRGQIAFGADISQTPSTISLLRAADLSTFIHETGHFFLEATFHMAGQANAPADIAADVSTILNWFEPGMTLAQWNGMSLEERRPYHEKWARGFEAYHFEGRAPSLALRDLFRRFSAWLKNVYRTLTALDVELTDDVRAVMDRMLASEQEIVEAEQARSFAPLFTSRPEGMTEDEWAELQRLGNDATAEAIEQLEQRSARDMRWASGAKDRYVRSLQREAEEQRKAIRAEVTAEVMAEPVNRARNFLRRGLGENGEPVENAAKLDLATLKELYGEDGRWTGLRRGGKYGEVATDGMHPDVVAGMFGYRNGEALIADLLDAENAQDKIKGLTDQRMLERYGDLSDPQSIERAANEAVANDARAKFVAAEMAALDKSVGKRSILNSAARDNAARVVNRLELRRLRPAQYLAAQGRAARAAEKALRKDDLVAAATAKRNQLINLHVARAVQQAQKDVERNSRLFTRIVSAKDDAAARTRNMDLVNAARAILSMYGFGRVKNDPIGYMEALKRYDPTLYADLQPFIEQARANAKPMHELTYEEFVGVRDTVGQLWALSRRVKQVEIDGKLVDLLSVTEELGARLDNIGIPADRPGMSRAVTESEKRTFDLLGIRAALRRVESWARGLDQADTGPFRRYVWNPVSEAANRYRAESGVYSKRFRALLDSVRDELKPRDIAAPEIGYTFGGKAELYHALLHTGNGSNKSKLLLGRRWGTRDADGMLDDSRWQSFIDRLHTEGVLTERDWNFVQAVWDLLEGTKAGAQRAHRAIYGRYFDEVAADPVDTPFGQYRGGYVPALTDQNLVQDAVLRAEQEAIEGGDSAMFPAASNGFTKSRVEDYTRELALDLRLLPMHLDKVLRFTHLGPPVRDVMRILKNRAFSAKLEAFDPTAQSDLLLPWLQRAAKQIVETPSKGRAGKAADRAFSYIRSAAGMQLMFANVVNTAQQLTGFSGVLLRVKGGNLNRALFRYTRDPKGVADAAHAKSVLLRNRSDSELFEARQAITQLVRLDPSRKDQAVDFLKRHAYFMQSALQNVMDVVSWTAAYDQATERGESEAEAIRFADSVIRETQGSMAPEDVSRFETGSPFVRMFTQFAGYFNMMANLAGTEVQQVARGVGLKRGAGRLFYIYLMTLLIPAVIGDGIAKALRGGWEDEDEDGYLNDLIPWFFASQAKFTLAAVPGVGQAANAALGAFTDVPYDDRVSLSPAISLIEAGVGTPAEVYQSLVEGESFNRTDLRDALNLLGIMTGTPAGVLGRPVGYGLGVAQGDIEPTGPVDVARGLATGNPSPESRTN